MTVKNVKIVIAIAVILIISGFLGYTYHADASALSNIIVTIENINIQQLGLSYCDLKIRVNMSNPNDRSVSNLAASFAIYITENYVGDGSFSKVSIPALSYREKDVTVTIFYAEVANAVVDGIKKREFTLSIEGEVSGNVLFDLITISEQFKASKAYL